MKTVSPMETLQNNQIKIIQLQLLVRYLVTLRPFLLGG